MNKKQRENEKRQTPIVDGDARPDTPANPENEQSRRKQNQNPRDTENKFESERLSDVNSIEDYKDAE